MKKISRRHFLTYTAASGLSITTLGNLTACSKETSLSNSHSHPIIVGGFRRTDFHGKRLDEYGVLALQARSSLMNTVEHSLNNYSIVSDFSVPNEVHLACLFPKNDSILICSRVPGSSLLKYSLEGELQAELKPLPNQHFEGHGIFSSDEKFLYVTSTNFQQSMNQPDNGRLLKINIDDLTLVEEYSTGGIGPHELVWQSNTHIAIANTGVLTHPDSGRKILNKDNIQSNIVLFNTDTKSIDHQWQVPLLGLSARHMDRMDNGDLVIGCQYKKQDQRPACVAFAKKNKTLIFSDKNNESIHWDMKGYTASIKALPNSNKALITNPRGGLLTQWQEQNFTDKTEIKFNKGIKISKTGQQAWVSKGPGELLLLNTDNIKQQGKAIKVKQNIWWANHLG